MVRVAEAVSPADFPYGHTFSCQKGTDLGENQIVFVFTDCFAGFFFEVHAHFGFREEQRFGNLGGGQGNSGVALDVTHGFLYIIRVIPDRKRGGVALIQKGDNSLKEYLLDFQKIQIISGIQKAEELAVICFRKR